jgi:hypothetical protein
MQRQCYFTIILALCDALKHMIFQTSSCEARSRSKLTGDDRTAKLSVLLDSGWKEVEGRDAIFKEFVFKNFNQVLFVVDNASMCRVATF